MANAVQHGQSSTGANNLRKNIADLVCGGATPAWSSGTNQKLILYTGSPPTNASTAATGSAVSTITLITWGAASTSGVSTITASTADSNATGNVSAVGYFRLYRTAATDPGDVIIQGTVGTSGSDLNINNTVINAGANVSLTSGTYTAPL